MNTTKVSAAKPTAVAIRRRAGDAMRESRYSNKSDRIIVCLKGVVFLFSSPNTKQLKLEGKWGKQNYKNELYILKYKNEADVSCYVLFIIYAFIPRI